MERAFRYDTDVGVGWREAACIGASLAQLRERQLVRFRFGVFAPGSNRGGAAIDLFSPIAPPRYGGISANAVVRAMTPRPRLLKRTCCRVDLDALFGRRLMVRLAWSTGRYHVAEVGAIGTQKTEGVA